MAYLINLDLQKDGTLPPKSWKRAPAAQTEAQALQFACDHLKLEQLPFTVHIADTKHLYPNGTPYMTKAITIDVEKEAA